MSRDDSRWRAQPDTPMTCGQQTGWIVFAIFSAVVLLMVYFSGSKTVYNLDDCWTESCQQQWIWAEPGETLPNRLGI